MKKIFVFFLAILYITSSCQASVYLHYCMGKQVGFSFSATPAERCTSCGMKKSAKAMGCCKDEQKVIKMDPSQKQTDLSVFNLAAKKNVLPAVPFQPSLYSYCQPLANSYSISEGPPGAGVLPVYILHSVFKV